MEGLFLAVRGMEETEGDGFEWRRSPREGALIPLEDRHPRV